MRFLYSYLLLLGFLFMTACGTMRGIPSHGGGKRFDEEQRAVSACIRRAIADMHLASLRGKRVDVQFNAISHSGGATMAWPGLDSLSIGGSQTHNDVEEQRQDYSGADTGSWTRNYRDVIDYASLNKNMNLRVRLREDYRPFSVSTNSDEHYLRGVLYMYLMHHGAVVTSTSPDVYLNVLIDVLGTNRSRSNYLVYSRDHLQAACELTYFAVENDGEIILPAARSGATACYSESAVLMVSGVGRQRVTGAMVVSDIDVPPVYAPIGARLPKAKPSLDPRAESGAGLCIQGEAISAAATAAALAAQLEARQEER